MHVRMTFVKAHADNASEMETKYNAEIAPMVKRAKGNIDCFLLRSLHDSDEYISVTMWHTKADGDAYDSSGEYKAMVDKVRPTFSAVPTLKTFEKV